MIKKNKDSWYKNNTWSGDIDTRFEKQLRYTRNPTHKAGFLQVQGSLLLLNHSLKIQEVGQVLLSRLFDNHPTEHSQVQIAQENLGDYFFKHEKYEAAAPYFKTVMLYCDEQQSRTNTSFITDLKWAECILKLNLAPELPAALERVNQYPPALLKTMELQYYHAELGALIAHAMEDKAGAKVYAQAAMKLFTLLKPNPAAARMQKLKAIIEG